MLKTLIPFPSIAQLAKTDIAYATQNPALKPFYHYAPELDNFAKYIKERAEFPTDRQLLADVLTEQYQEMANPELALKQIEDLRQADTFTVTTAHQPSLFLGPLYFIYKAISTINLAAQVEKYTGKRIVPVFVLGSEDHDLEELNHIRLFNKELRWEPGLSGPVGKMPAKTLQPVLETLKEILGGSENALALQDALECCYNSKSSFASATQAFLHNFLGKHGLLVFNMGHKMLKRKFIPIMRDELLNQSSHPLIAETMEQLAEIGFKAQANPREINLFYLQPGRRDRIVLEEDRYIVLDTDLSFTQAEILTELEEHPERFSPNVILRPLYQEMILPNLAYVGGGGELAYWLERKSQFAHYQIPYPILVRRNSVLWFDKDSIKRSLKFGFKRSRYFDDTDALVRSYIEAQADAEISLETEMQAISQIYDTIAHKAKMIDPTLEKAVRADEVKASGQIKQWEGRLIRAEKQKHEIALNQLRNLKEKLFPASSLQERYDNFIPYYLKNGERFFTELLQHLDPLESGFVLLEDLGETN